MKLQLVGGGKMGQALAGGLLNAGWANADELAIVEVDGPLAEQLQSQFPGVTITDTPLRGVDAILAVKPWAIVEVASGLDTPGRVMSIAAGITIASIEAVVPAGTPVIRVMPNTPALVGEGASALAPGASAADDDVAWATSILAAVGAVDVVTEAQLDAVTGLSGSGPAYFFLIAEALADAGVTAGLARGTAEMLVNQTMLGAARMLLDTDDGAAVLRAGVTTPAGTTAAGVRVLEQQGVRAALIDAVEAATERSRQLGS
ncbi:MAG: pyrroline-5-carboxylate reductase [Acidimicrobiales bacterium]|jgi:pyrroline-5-carboxylate reductase